MVGRHTCQIIPRNEHMLHGKVPRDKNVIDAREWVKGGICIQRTKLSAVVLNVAQPVRR